MAEEKKITAEEFVKGLRGFPHACASCKSFTPDESYCKFHDKEVKYDDPKCEYWRYFA